MISYLKNMPSPLLDHCAPRHQGKNVFCIFVCNKARFYTGIVKSSKKQQQTFKNLNQKVFCKTDDNFKNLIYFFVCAETSHINKKNILQICKKRDDKAGGPTIQMNFRNNINFFLQLHDEIYVKLEWGIFKNICNLHSDVDLERLFLSILSILNILTCFLEIVHYPIELQ